MTKIGLKYNVHKNGMNYIYSFVGKDGTTQSYNSVAEADIAYALEYPELAA